MTKQIENILYAIRRYSIDGTEGLEKAIKSFFSDLAIVESHLDNKDKKNPIYKNCQSWVSTLLISLLYPSAYDIIGVYPTITDLLELRGKKYNRDIELEVIQWTGI